MLAGTRQATREAYMDVRESIDGLRLAADHAGGLASVLAEYIEEFEDRTGIETDLDAGMKEKDMLAELRTMTAVIGQ